MKNSLIAEVKHQDRGNKMKMLNLVEQSIQTFIKSAAAEMKIQKKQLNLQDKKDDMIKMMQEGKDVHSNIIMPVYEKDTRLKIYREKNKPPSSIYYEVGYDGPITSAEPAVRNKHYRKYYVDELENNKQIFFRKTFSTIDIKRGQSRGLNKGILDMLLPTNTDESGFKTSEKVIGQFKGHIHVHNKRTDEEYDLSKGRVMKKIQEQINDICHVKHDKDFESDIFGTTTAEERDQMK